MIDLYFAPTTNGRKITIALNEMNLPFRPILHHLPKGDHLTAEFKKINPNNKIPVVVDHDPADGGGPISVFESGAILIYLAEKTGQFLSTELRRRMLTLQWLAWQISGLGPMHGQAHHFIRYAREQNPYGIDRYLREARRLLNVLEYRLEQAEYVAEEYSIADIAIWPQVKFSYLIGFDLAEFPRIERWVAAIEQRPAVQKTFDDPGTGVRKSYVLKKPVLTDEEWSNLFGDAQLGASHGPR